jgi:GTPase Era involved in 16S rRNA processing
MKLFGSSLINITVFGNTNSGKSTLINKILGKSIMETNFGICTRFFWQIYVDETAPNIQLVIIRTDKNDIECSILDSTKELDNSNEN